jgi:NADH:ubiquinone oxidoreductase subunit 5 (subunit L)/multisubunit Na+/H+ antiporter MnhA subunit
VYYVNSRTGVLTFDIQELSAQVLPYRLQVWAFLAFFLAFAIKVPMFPVHTWLPDAHVEAPTAGSVILAGVLLKMGGYGMLRFCLPFFPDAAVDFILPVVVLSVVAIVYGALVSLVQKDLKKLVAYSSVSHMGFVTAGIFASIAVLGNAAGMEGAILVMLSHGVLTGALFLMVGFIYERTHTREIARMGTLAKPLPGGRRSLPVLRARFARSARGLSGFVGEFLSLLGLFEYSRWLAAVGALGVILAACYLLWMYQRVFFNDRGDDDVRPLEPLRDLGVREIVALAPLVVFAVWIGVYPNTFLDFLHVPVQEILDRVTPSLPEAGAGGSRRWSTSRRGSSDGRRHADPGPPRPRGDRHRAGPAARRPHRGRKAVLAWIASAGLVAAAVVALAQWVRFDDGVLSFGGREPRPASAAWSGSTSTGSTRCSSSAASACSPCCSPTPTWRVTTARAASTTASCCWSSPA